VIDLFAKVFIIVVVIVKVQSFLKHALLTRTLNLSCQQLLCEQHWWSMDGLQYVKRWVIKWHLKVSVVVESLIMYGKIICSRCFDTRLTNWLIFLLPRWKNILNSALIAFVKRSHFLDFSADLMLVNVTFYCWWHFSIFTTKTYHIAIWSRRMCCLCLTRKKLLSRFVTDFLG